MNALAAMRKPFEISGLSPVLARRITVLGSTGSIGVSTLSVIAHAREVYGADALPVEALTAQSNVDVLIEQARAIEDAGDLASGTLTLTDAATAEILEAARIAAHESGDRRNAPLLCYLMGVAAGLNAVPTSTALTALRAPETEPLL